MHDILCTIGDFDAEARKILAPLGTLRCATTDRATLLKQMSAATILIVGLGHNIDEEVFAAGKKLSLVATLTTGTDHIDLDAAARRNIRVISLQNEREFLRSVTGTAELAWGLLMNLLRYISAATEDVKNGRWDRAAFRGHQLSGKTLGIAGVGRLGEMMVRYGTAFGMRVLGYDSAPRSVSDCTFVPLERLLKESDCVSIHLPLTPQTEGLFGEKLLTLMKPTSVLVNTARGKIVDERAIVKALEAGRLTGYAADVLSDELGFTSKAVSPLIDYARTHRNVLITPHIGGMTAESRSATDVFIARKVRDTLSRA